MSRNIYKNELFWLFSSTIEADIRHNHIKQVK